jgi:5'-phosphate synthase pdxT subunit
VIERAGDDVTVLARFEERPVLCRQRTILVASFHPELTADDRLHRTFLEM